MKDRIPVLDDIVHQVVVEHGQAGPASMPAPVLSSETIETLVDTLHREFLDRVTRSLHEAIAREEAGLRSAIRAHLEVTLPEVVARQGPDAADAGAHRRAPVAARSATAAKPGAEPKPAASADTAMPRPVNGRRHKLRLPRKRKASAKARA